MDITPTPIIYVEDIRLNDLSINGAVFSIAEDGTYVPEVGAFVYVYINDLLSNEAANGESLLTRGSRSGYVTTTDSDGKWICPVSSIRSGLRITATAHAVGKSMSLPSVPYRVGSLPVPTELHVVDRYGNRVAAKHGQYSVEGFFEGLQNRKYERPVGFVGDDTLAADKYLFPYTSNFDLCPYIDGIKQPCMPDNEIWSRNFIDQSVDINWEDCFTILVQGSPVEICLDGITNVIYSEVFTYYDLDVNGNVVSNSLQIHPPDEPAIITVYKNGRRLIEGVNRDYVLWTSPSSVSVLFNAGTDLENTDTYTVDYLAVPNTERPYYNSVVVSNSTLASFGVNKGTGLQVYRDGLRLKELIDFTVAEASGDKIVTLAEPLDTEDVLELDYFTSDISITPHRVDTTINFVPEVETDITGQIATRSTIKVYLTGLATLPQMVIIYKDGLRLSFGADFDYTKVSESNPAYVEYELSPEKAWEFEAILEPSGTTRYQVTNNIVVELFYSSVANSKVITALNALPQFILNKLHATVVDNYLVISSPYTLEFAEGDTSYYNTFGQNPSFIPGKDEDGNFKYFVDFRNNRWRYTFDKPLKRLQAITAATFIRNQ